jgi:crossover junction endodeoxyribonuclease RuvC
MLVVGIDPGLTGALALIDRTGLVACADMPVMVRGNGKGSVKNQVNPAALRDILQGWANGHDRIEFHVVIENQRPFRLPGQKAQGSSSVFSLGLTTGIIEGVVSTMGFAQELVEPGVWKKALELSARGPDKKEIARTMAQRLYPQADLKLVKSHNRAEAILLARWGFLKHS